MADGDSSTSHSPSPAAPPRAKAQDRVPRELLPILVTEFRRNPVLMAREIADLRGRVPADGQVAVPQADADALAAYRALGKPDDLRTALTERETLKQDAARRVRADEIRAKAQDAGYAPAIVERLSRDPDAAFDVAEVAEVERDGQKVRTLLVRKAGTEDAPVDLDAYAAQHFPEFAATLRAGGAPVGGTSGTPRTGAPAPTHGLPNGAPRPAPAYPAAPLHPANGGHAPSDADLKREKAASAAYAI